MSEPIDLEKLPQLSELFRFFSAGKHLNRVSEPVLWAELEAQQPAYEALFSALGHELRVDARGFAWFQTQESSSAVNRVTRHLALLFMTLFDYQADSGLPLVQFEQWVIDHRLLDAVHDHHQEVLEAEELDREALTGVMDRAVNYGFAMNDNGAWRLLPAVHRYVEHFEELAAQVDSSEDWLLDTTQTQEPTDAGEGTES